MWSRSNRTTNRATSEVDVEVAIEVIMADEAETEVEGAGGVVVVAVGEEVLEERLLGKKRRGNSSFTSKRLEGVRNDTPGSNRRYRRVLLMIGGKP